MKILLAVPCMDTMPVGFVQSLLALEKHVVTSALLKPNSLIYDSRNIISITAIEQGMDAVMWFDSDMMFQPDTLRRLTNDMEELDCDMVTGLYFKRNGTSLPVIYDELDMPGTDADGKPVKHIHEYIDYPKNELFPVKGCGFGCVLTKTSLLKDVWDRFGPAFSPFPWAGEDIAFCYRVNQLGRKIYCDSAVQCGHIGTYVFSEETFIKSKR